MQRPGVGLGLDKRVRVCLWASRTRPSWRMLVRFLLVLARHDSGQLLVDGLDEFTDPVGDRSTEVGELILHALRSVRMLGPGNQPVSLKTAKGVWASIRSPQSDTQADRPNQRARLEPQ